MDRHKGRILYTEDDPESREMIRVLFTFDGYEIVCAESGMEALHLAKNEDFDLFLVDNWMPTVTGLELTKFIREFNQTTPILFYSGAAYDKDREAALKAGAQGYIVKPPDIDELLAEVGRLIREHRQSTG